VKERNKGIASVKERNKGIASVTERNKVIACVKERNKGIASVKERNKDWKCGGQELKTVCILYPVYLLQGADCMYIVCCK
jgi:hypothetical protein